MKYVSFESMFISKTSVKVRLKKLPFPILSKTIDFRKNMQNHVQRNSYFRNFNIVMGANFLYVSEYLNRLHTFLQFFIC